MITLEYLCKSSNKIAIVNTDYQECMTFDTFGGCLGEASFLSVLSNYRSQLQVDIVSILGEPGKSWSEVYFKGKKLVLDSSSMSVFSTLKSGLKLKDSVIYQISHKTVRQLIMIVELDKYSHSDLSDLLHSNNWLNL